MHTAWSLELHCGSRNCMHNHEHMQGTLCVYSLSMYCTRMYMHVLICNVYDQLFCTYCNNLYHVELGE